MRRFQVGDMVRYSGSRRVGAPPGPYEVLQCLPRDDHASDFSYRIKFAGEPVERVVLESELSPYS
jgi:hypothetical protein